MKIAVVGHGKMGKEVVKAASNKGYEVVAIVARGDDMRKKVGASDVVIDFSVPADASSHFARLFGCGLPVVIGSTGWEKERASVKALAENEGIAVLAGANFSVGMACFRFALRSLLQIPWMAEHYVAGGVEIHHADKRDAPSGTAKAISCELGVNFAPLRLGKVAGTHTVIFDSADDMIELAHRAKSRAGFATGALAAAEWLIGRRGFFSFDDFVAECVTPKEAPCPSPLSSQP